MRGTLPSVRIWKSLLLIYGTIDVQLLDQSGRSQHFAHALSDKEMQDGVGSFRHFPSLVENLTSGRAGVQYEIHRIERDLTSLTQMNEEMYWPSPTDTREEIDLLAAPGTCDSIFVLWPQHNFRDGTSVQSVGWGVVHRLAYNGDVVAFKMGRRQGARRAHI